MSRNKTYREIYLEPPKTTWIWGKTLEFDRTKPNRVGSVVKRIWFGQIRPFPVQHNRARAPMTAGAGNDGGGRPAPARVEYCRRDDEYHIGEVGSRWYGRWWPEYSWEGRPTAMVEARCGSSERRQGGTRQGSESNATVTVQVTVVRRRKRLEKTENGGDGGIQQRWLPWPK